ncbi:MAG TPA: epoxide hydrolase [Actinoplanes sp.]|nr:epoxide hydrolase [Actinoplanes sp.]
MTEIREFRIDIPQADLDDLAERLARVRWTDDFPDAGDDYGVSRSRVQALADRWQHGYDWRAWEKRLNAYPQFTTEIDGQNIHFLHVRSAQPGALPLLLTHSWPGTFVDFLPVIDRLSATFHLVIPSIPGFAFSGPTREKGWDRYRIAKAWAALMARLGYDRYGVHGNDAGSLISPEVGRFDRTHVAGVHVTQVFSFPSGDPTEFEGLSEEDMGRLLFLQWWNENGGAYDKLQSTSPATLAHALADSPVGQLGWNAQLLGPNLDPDFVLTNVSIYWFTNTAGSSARLYYEDRHSAYAPEGPTTVPLALANFRDDFQSIRRFGERDHRNIVSWTYYDSGSHYATQDAPDLLVDDITRFFAEVA